MLTLIYLNNVTHVPSFIETKLLGLKIDNLIIDWFKTKNIYNNRLLPKGKHTQKIRTLAQQTPDINLFSCLKYSRTTIACELHKEIIAMVKTYSLVN